MKNIIIAFFLMLAPVGVTAQYQKAHKRCVRNKPEPLSVVKFSYVRLAYGKCQIYRHHAVCSSVNQV